MHARILGIRSVANVCAAAAIVAGVFARPAATSAADGASSPTAIGKLAAGLEPGQSAELAAEGYDSRTLMRGEDILAYCGRAAWDATKQQVLVVGQVHLKGPPSFISYSVEDNRWRREPTPKWAEDLKWFHGYENNAADSARGVFFHHSSASPNVHRYDVSKDDWTTLPKLNAPTGHGTAIAYFPERKGLVRVLNKSAWFFSDEDKEWATLGTDFEAGPYHNFAEYSPKFRMVLFGGGNGSPAIHRIHADGKIDRGKDAPVSLGIGNTLNVADPVTGELLVLARGGGFFAYDPGADVWRTLPAESAPFPKYGGHSISAAPIGSEGVVLYFSSAPQGMKNVVYKHGSR
ncbi:MAG: hypothetical protein WD069_00115 [Planctomycetales bacterium]